MKKDETEVTLQHSTPSGKSILNPFSGMSIDFELRDMEVEGTFTSREESFDNSRGTSTGGIERFTISIGMHYTP